MQEQKYIQEDEIDLREIFKSIFDINFYINNNNFSYYLCKY